MDSLKKQVYIVGHDKDKATAEKIAAQLNNAGVPNSISCGQNVRQINASAVNCDAALVILSKNSETPESIENIVNMLTGKEVVKYNIDDAELSPRMQYFLEKSKVIEDADDIASEISRILKNSEVKKDVLILTEGNKTDKAEIIRANLAYEGVSSAILPYDSGLEQQVNGCYMTIAVCSDKSSDSYKKAVAESKRRRIRIAVYNEQPNEDEKKFDKNMSKILKKIDRIKPPSRVILTENTGNIDFIKKPAGRLLLTIIFAQIAVFLLWLTSKHNIFYGIAFLAAIAIYIFVVKMLKRRCDYKGCKNNHGKIKTRVIVSKNKKQRIYRFCGTHSAVTNLSSEKNTYLVMTVAATVVTAAFIIFLAVAKVTVSDFTFLDLRQRLEAQRQAVFVDEGFEAFVRKSYDLGNNPISYKTLSEMKYLIFNKDEAEQPIESLEDLKYFPNLEVFSTMDTEDISGDIMNFSYTPKLKELYLNDSNIYGDIAGLSGLTELEIIHRNYGSHFDTEDEINQIYGDISAFENMPLLKRVNIPDSNLSGSLEAFRGKDLEVLLLPYTSISGDISILEGMKNLYDLGLCLTDLTGDISVFEDINKLISLSIGESNVTGDISVLSDLDLEVLELASCDVYGDIAALKNMSSLKLVGLYDNDVSGDIEVFSNMKDLYSLRIDDTNVTGDVKVFGNTLELETICLDNTEVYGDPEVFLSLENLIEWSCYNTNVKWKNANVALNSDPMTVARTILIEPMYCLSEGTKAMNNNAGDMFGYADIKRLGPNGDYFQFVSVGNDAWVPHCFKILDETPDVFTAKVFMIKFQPKDAENLAFNFTGENRFSITFKNNKPCFFNENDRTAYPFHEFMKSNVNLNAEKWYYAIFAFEPDGGFRSVIWEDGKAEERAVFETQLNDLSLNKGESGWETAISFDAGGVFNIESYWMLEDMGFTKSITTEAQNADAASMPMVQALLNDPKVIFSEDKDEMANNNGGNFGDAAIKQLKEDGRCYQFISNDDGAYMIGNINFLDAGDFRGNAQSVLIKFQPENVDDLSFTLFGNGEIILRFENGQPNLIHVQDNYRAPYANYMPTELTLENDKWYWAMMAFDANGYYRSLVWEDGNPENQAYCAENMGDWHNEYKGSNWHLTISFGPNQTLNIEEYSILDFENFKDNYLSE